MKEENAYILGTDKEELHRLGVQHQVWASEAQQGWINAGFTRGHHLLDLGSGPGFCSKELAFITGSEGSVTAIDRSEHFIDFLNQIKDQYQLPINAICSDFKEMELPDNYFDGMYCRWALAWVSNPTDSLLKIKGSLKKGGKMVLHEYYDWSTLQTEPDHPSLTYAIKMALKSLKEQEGEIDLGRYLPKMLSDIGMKIVSKRLMTKLATPDHINWQWPNTFYHSYFPRLVETGYLTHQQCEKALSEMAELSKNENATLFCPMMIEVIAEKI